MSTDVNHGLIVNHATKRVEEWFMGLLYQSWDFKFFLSNPVHLCEAPIMNGRPIMTRKVYNELARTISDTPKPENLSIDDIEQIEETLREAIASQFYTMEYLSRENEKHSRREGRYKDANDYSLARRVWLAALEIVNPKSLPMQLEKQGELSVLEKWGKKIIANCGCKNNPARTDRFICYSSAQKGGDSLWSAETLDGHVHEHAYDELTEIREWK